MKKLSLTTVLLVALAIVLEALPIGAVLIFATPESSYRQLFSYFDPITYGYANVGPFMTALLSCALLVLSLLAIFLRSRAIRTSITVISAISLATSLMPLMFGIAYFTPVSAAISLLLIGTLVLSIISLKKHSI